MASSGDDAGKMFCKAEADFGYLLNLPLQLGDANCLGDTAFVGNLWVIQLQGNFHSANWENLPTLGCSSDQLLLSVHRTYNLKSFHIYALSKQVHEYSHRHVILKDTWSLRHVIDVEAPDMYCTIPAKHPSYFVHIGNPHLIALDSGILYYRRGCRMMSCDIEIGKAVSISLQDHPASMGPFRFFPYIQPRWPASVRPLGSVIEKDDDSPDGEWCE